MDLIYWLVFSSIRSAGDLVKGVDGGIVIFDSCEQNFIRVHENLVRHPSNIKSIFVCNKSKLIDGFQHIVSGPQTKLKDSMNRAVFFFKELIL